MTDKSVYKKYTGEKMRNKEKTHEKDLNKITFIDNRHKSVFKNKSFLSDSFLPEILPHRDNQITALTSILSPAIKCEKPHNTFIFGGTGVGKTAVTKFIGKSLIPYKKKINWIYIDCSIINTDYEILQVITKSIINKKDKAIPEKGWSISKIHKTIIPVIDNDNNIVILVLDEIESMDFKKLENALYQIIKINNSLKKPKICIIGLCCNWKIIDFFNPKLKSRLDQEALSFPAYDVEQLKDILIQRAKLALNKNTFKLDIISLSAAFAAQEGGDARKAIHLLRRAGEIADRKGSKIIDEIHVREAYNKIRKNYIPDLIKIIPLQLKLLLLAMIYNEEFGYHTQTINKIYNTYLKISKEITQAILEYNDIINKILELKTLGIISIQFSSSKKNRIIKDVSLVVPSRLLRKYFEKELIEKIQDIRVSHPLIQIYENLKNSKSNREKGKLLEQFSKKMLSLIKGFNIEDNDVNVRTRNEEIDLIIRNDSNDNFWKRFDTPIIVECKNWSKPIGVKEVVHFIDKIRERGLKIGILISINGITGNEYKDAFNKILNVRDKIKIIVITRVHIEKVLAGNDPSEILKEEYFNLMRK